MALLKGQAGSRAAELSAPTCLFCRCRLRAALAASGAQPGSIFACGTDPCSEREELKFHPPPDCSADEQETAGLPAHSLRPPFGPEMVPEEPPGVGCEPPDTLQITSSETQPTLPRAFGLQTPGYSETSQPDFDQQLLSLKLADGNWLRNSGLT